ncbi:YhgE/Pip domain-containing protein [Clostridium sp. YIM B02551]|uniref:YhgE/Pip domain-containing protein n=1 Tax=Clostridium sp. YIM B02551 TaxID=2910679 RepID=UPI001EEBC2D4|nr:YhgE/Pip domain-containing protein [Clostridium sp. YIM B02551]
MKFLKVAKEDLSSIYKNRFLRFAIAGIIIVPLLYSLLYLAAFWDPYSRMDKLPVAVVNLDAGATMDGKEVNYGKDITDELKDNKDMGWRFVSYQDAVDGTKGDKYYSMFVIPEDFSKNIVTAKDSTPVKADIIYTSNNRKNFLASQIGSKVEDKLKATINEKISKEYVKVTYENLDTVKSGMNDAADGSGKLADGLTTLKGNIPALEDGVNKLYDGSNQLNGGLAELNKNVSTINPAELVKISSYLTPENKEKITNIIATARQFENKDLSSLDKITPETINQVNKSFTDLQAVTNSNGLKVILSQPSIQKLVVQMNPNNPDGYQQIALRMQNVDKLLADATALQGTLTDLQGKIPKELLNADANAQLENLKVLTVAANNLQSASKLITNDDITKLSALLSNPSSMQALITKIETTNNQLKNINAGLDQMLKPLKDAGMTDDQAINALNTNIQGLINSIRTQAAAAASTNAPTIQVPTSSAALIAGSLTLTEGLLSNKALLTDASTQLTSLDTLVKSKAYVMAQNPNSVTALKNLLDNYNPTMTAINNEVPLLNSLGQLMTPDNIKEINGLMANVGTLKTDIANNQDNLNLLMDVARVSKDPSVKALIPKLMSVQTDINNAKPILSDLSSPQTMELLQNSPKYVGMVKGLQKDLKTNDQMLAAANTAISQGKIEEAKTLINGLPALTSGVSQLYDGSTQLKGGLGDLKGSVPELKDGVTKLSDGSNELSSKLKDGASDLDKGLVNTPDEMGTFISNPVNMDNKIIDEVKNYGTGFAPYFIPLSLWVGALMMFFVLSPKSKAEREGKKMSSISVVLGKYMTLGLIGVVQAILASLIVLALGLSPQNMALYFLFNMLMSLTFVAMIQFFITTLGDGGKLIAIVLLILQLTACAGTFPLEVVPNFFKVLNPYMPFTYAVKALREAISGTDVSVIAQCSGVFALISVVFVSLTIVFKKKGDYISDKIEEVKQAA